MKQDVLKILRAANRSRNQEFTRLVKAAESRAKPVPLSSKALAYLDAIHGHIGRNEGLIAEVEAANDFAVLSSVMKRFRADVETLTEHSHSLEFGKEFGLEVFKPSYKKYRKDDFRYRRSNRKKSVAEKGQSTK